MVNDAPKLRVLLAEDEPSIRRSLERFLTLKGVEVMSVADGVAALSAITDGDFDIVISDVQMPIVSGVDLWHQASERRPDLKNRWIFVSAHSSTAVPEVARGRYLQKPFELETVWQMVLDIADDHFEPGARRRA